MQPCAVADTDTTEIKLYHKDIRGTLEIVHDLRAQGLEQGRDFDFAFYQTRWDEMIGEIPNSVEFRFYDSRWATWFSLKWA